MNEMRKATPPDSSPPARGARMPFRTRLFTSLLLVALVPTIAVTGIWTMATRQLLTRTSASAAWERMAVSGDTVVASLSDGSLSADQRALLDRHATELRRSAEQARRFDFVLARAMRLVLLVAGAVLLLLALAASRVAGHLSRQLSRPLDELVGWTGLVRRGEPLPPPGVIRGAPEFEVLRSGMRTMTAELEAGRRRALEMERAEAFRESARRFAHELKNPLTPIRFAVDRLRRGAPTELQDTVEVLAEEATRLDTMARSFAQFGRLPDGPAADVDMAELVTRVAQSAIPESIPVQIDCAPALPFIRGHHESLVRAVANVMHNAVEASATGGRIAVRVDQREERLTVEIRDTGCGIAPADTARIFDPYVTTKAGGTGLGLAIARQTIEAHAGTIAVTSTVGVGTTMTIRLPISSEEPPPAAH